MRYESATAGEFLGFEPAQAAYAVPAPARPAPTEPAFAEPLGLLAVQLAAKAGAAGGRGVIHVAGGERRAERLGAAVRGLRIEGLQVVVLPPWDCLPYDRSSPSRSAMGRRVVALRRLAAQRHAGPRLLITVPEGLIQRVPPREALAGAALRLRVGEAFHPAAVEAYLRRAGYAFDERVDEPGEAALRGQVVDLFPAGRATPYRVEHAEGRIVAIRAYDPLTQRSIEEVETLGVWPASEAILQEGSVDDPAAGRTPEPEHEPGIEHWLADLYPRLETSFDLMPEADIVIDPGVEERRAAFLESVTDAYASRLKPRGARRSVGDVPERAPAPPERLYLSEAEWTARLGGRCIVALEAPADEAAPPGLMPRFATARSPDAAFAAHVEAEIGVGRRVLLTAATRRDLAAMARRAGGREARPVSGWDEALGAEPGALLTMPLDLDAGFVDEASGIAVIAAADLLGSRAGARSAARAGEAAGFFGEAALGLGDAIVHIDHGLGRLDGIEAIEVMGAGAGDAVRVAYSGDTDLMVPCAEIGRLWRYGADAGAVALDKLDGGAWEKRRTRIEEELMQTARGLVALARAREAAHAPVLSPPRRDYERFVARFPFPETPDQARAIEDTLADLASGRPADRLVCGDVGFGKTEVALRAAAAAALSGKQAMIVAPTTVLVRQHLRAFERRFAGLGVKVGHLSRLVSPAEAGVVREGLADGSVRVVVGTHALVGKGVAFHDLGLVVVDEEQRFGAAHKARLREMAAHHGAHVLTLTATPIPRTLQAALVGLQSLSVIATPPSRRRPIRTGVAAFDEGSVREALLRERGRGGQSFLVCPRIEDIGPMAERLARIVPELDVTAVHGKMPPSEVDEAMVRFSDGDGDMLLATNIIESGLDVPRANTMLIWRADRFGLSQLHQLRGRVGRGRAQGFAYLLTDPEAKVAPATLKRLSTLAALDRLGAGFAVSARDLDQRGAGDLMGEEQAGHVKLIGVGLYQHMLERALRAARGEPAAEEAQPELNLGLAGHLPAAYVPDPETRINLYARLAAIGDEDGIEAIEEEVADRFGPAPEEVVRLLALARLRAACRRLGILRVDAGPAAIAFTFREGAEATEGVQRACLTVKDLRWHEGRLVLTKATETPEQRLRLAALLLARIETGGGPST